MLRRDLRTLFLIFIGIWLVLSIRGGFGAEKPAASPALNNSLANAVVEVRVSASSDDAEESDSGSVSLTSSDLELVYDSGDGNQKVGMRFNGLEIPQGATIVGAYLQFQADESGSELTDLTIHGQDADHALTFIDSDGNVSSRLLTDAVVPWPSVPAWPTRGEAGSDQRTPDIAAIVQEIVDRPRWASGNSIVIIITGRGTRTAEAFDGEQAAAPLLHVEYTVEPPAPTPTPTPTGTPPGSGVVRVPEDYGTIQAAIDAAADGDLVLVGPGTYTENLTIAGKSVILASHFHTTGDDSFIEQTIIDGQEGLGAGLATIAVAPTAGPQTRITGFTIQNGDDGILAEASLEIDHNLVVNNVDGLDYEDGAGRCHDNVFQSNRDDGIDFDGDTAAIVENNLIHFNDDDGIEIRLHEYSGPTLTITLRGNVIHGNGEDGIQLIDYPDVSDRVFHIERNRITNNAMVGLGLMDGGVTTEDFRAAPIPERIHLNNNTFSGNPYAVTGGANLIALNNLFVDSPSLGLKNVAGEPTGSIVAYNLFWNNGADYEGSNVDATTSVFGDPLLDVDYGLQPGSPAMDAGTDTFEWNGEIVLDIPPDQYDGLAPDLGWSETSDATPTATPTDTPIPPTATNTPLPPTDTPTATNTPLPPTDTPTATNTPLPPTDTPTATNTPLPPTDTPTATNTPLPPTDTPTATNTPLPPTDTPTATNTPLPPTDTPTATNTSTSTPTATATPSPTPTNTPTPTAEPATVDDVATGEISSAGAIAGTYLDTWANDGSPQTLMEEESNGKPADRYSFLQHTWIFDVSGGSGVTLFANAWRSPSADGDSFTLAYSMDDVNYTTISTIDRTADGDTYDAYLLPDSTEGMLYVRIVDTNREPGNRALDTVSVDHLFVRSQTTLGSVPAPPSGLSASTVTTSQIDLTWIDNASNELGFHIERSTDGITWMQVDTTGPDVTSYSDAGLEASTTYHYRVRAYNAAGFSDYSNVVTATTKDPSTGLSMHVAGLDSEAIWTGNSRWQATVGITIRDETGEAVAGATVTGVWSDGASGSDSCVTDEAGHCLVGQSNIKSNVGVVTFTVTDVASDGYTYDASSNLQSSISVSQPF